MDEETTNLTAQAIVIQDSAKKAKKIIHEKNLQLCLSIYFVWCFLEVINIYKLLLWQEFETTNCKIAPWMAISAFCHIVMETTICCFAYCSTNVAYCSMNLVICNYSCLMLCLFKIAMLIWGSTIIDTQCPSALYNFFIVILVFDFVLFLCFIIWHIVKK